MSPEWQTTLTALAPIVTAIATVVYTIGTLFLWLTTRRSLRTMEDAFRLNLLQAYLEAKQPPPSVDSRNSFFDNLGITKRGKHQRLYADLLQRVFADEFKFLISDEEKQLTPQRK